MDPFPTRRPAARVRCLVPALLLAWALAPTPARAEFLFNLSTSVTPAPGGLFSYQYSLAVSPNSTVGAASFVLGADAGANPTNLTGPTGWDVDFLQVDKLLLFLSPDPVLDIAPGRVGTFSFLSPQSPNPTPYTAFGFTKGGTVLEASGIVPGPTVPEPSTFVLLGTGAPLLLLGFLLRSRKAACVAAVLGAALLSPFGLSSPALASDHADTRENVARLGSDMTDVFIFPSKENPNNVVLVTTVRPLITPDIVDAVFFDPGLLIQFKIDTSGDFVEDQVIQVRFDGFGPGQGVLVSGPARPVIVGNEALFARRHPFVGTFNQTFRPAPQLDMRVFCGVREDPFFFDVERLNQIFPDRGIAIFGQDDLPSAMFPFGPNDPQFLSWRPRGQARDFLENLSVLAVVVELPRAALGGGLIRMWCTVNVPTGPPRFRFLQQERLARPIVNEALATISNNRHSVNNMINPTQDIFELDRDIESFLTFPAGRSPQIRQVIRSVLVPDVMVANLASGDRASYLGVETNGATGGRFGGRDLLDDVVDMSLGVIFGTTISDLGLAPDDGAAIPALTSDNVDWSTKGFLDVFPYLGNPDR